MRVKQSFRFLLVMLLALGITMGAARGTSAQGNSWQGKKMPGELTAQGTGGGGKGGEQVTKTFELTILGTPAEGESHAVLFETDDPNDTSDGLVIFCGDVEPDCEGAGTVYSGSVTVAAGTEIVFAFGRLNENDANPPTFYEEGTEVLLEDVTNAVTFDYGTDGKTGAGDDQQDGTTGAGDDQQDGTTGAGGDKQDGDTGSGDDKPEEMPTTGGVMVGATVPLGSAAAAFSLLVTSGYLVRMRR